MNIKEILLATLMFLVAIFGISITVELANIHKDNIETNTPMYEKYYEWDMANTGEVLYDPANHATSGLLVKSDGKISQREFDSWLTYQ